MIIQDLTPIPPLSSTDREERLLERGEAEDTSYVPSGCVTLTRGLTHGEYASLTPIIAIIVIVWAC